MRQRSPRKRFVMCTVVCLVLALFLPVHLSKGAVLFPSPIPSSQAYGVEGFYTSIDIPQGAKTLTALGQWQDVETLYIPTQIEPGRYVVYLTREAADLYSIEGKDILIHTRYCTVFGYRNKAFLTVKSPYGYEKGKVLFMP